MKTLVLVSAMAATMALPSANFQPANSFQLPAKIQAAPAGNDCVLGRWSEWTECDAQCDEASFQSRTRQILKEGSGYGRRCNPMELEEWRQCQGPACPKDCVMAEWSAWASCSVSCGPGGQRSRLRSPLSLPANGGAPCGPSQESEPCSSGPCSVDCKASPWSQWSRCSAKCGEGRRSRVRFELVKEQNGGRPCGPKEEWEACNDKPCSVDCEMAPWTQWSACSADCGEGRRARTRSIKTQPQNGGLACGPQEEWEACLDRPCPSDCEYSEWQAWSPCPACGTQISRSRSRLITQQGANGGLQCDFGSLGETEQCNIRPCAVDCKMAPWTQWSQCSAPCGEGRRARTRLIETPAQNGGIQCGPQEEWEACNDRPCAVDCEMSEWSQWSQCSADCNGGQRARTRSIKTQALNGGLACGPQEEWEGCNNHACAQDCAYGDWQPWSPCPACGEAVSRTRFRPITQNGAFGGLACHVESLSETEQCLINPCPVDCIMTPWSQYSLCSASCGQGHQSRARAIQTPARFGGLPCGPQQEVQACDAGACPIDCKVSPWTAWSKCSAQCGPGQQSRRRIIGQGPQNGGKACPSLEDWRQCNDKPCQAPTSYSAPAPAPVPAPLPVAPVFNPAPKTIPRPLPIAPVPNSFPLPSAKPAPRPLPNAPVANSFQLPISKPALPVAPIANAVPLVAPLPLAPAPSSCSGVADATLIPSVPCTAEFSLCFGGKAFPKVCSGDAVFDPADSTCKAIAQIPACQAQAPPAPAPGFFQRIREYLL